MQLSDYIREKACLISGEYKPNQIVVLVLIPKDRDDDFQQIGGFVDNEIREDKRVLGINTLLDT